ncbi:MAG TPA: indole-3-glycerol phosphate synthase TrpC [Gemmatimonadaceae bacterium]|nr:indole-3-glycerol phosphate synthase TrpC [Gemmatimonadaceae bacterium]
MLGRLTERAAERAAAARASAGSVRALERAAAAAPAPPSFKDALRRPEVAVVAEVKRRSPSKGAINPGLSAAAQALAYAEAGAAAVSVLTEPEDFGGSLADLEEARRAVRVPLLRKDFIVDDVQILEARAAGASAVLLIARALEPAVLPRLVASAHALSLDALVEVRDERELERALAAGSGVVGVNNRNLETLAIDAAVGDRLLPMVPRDWLALWESGVRDVEGVRRAATAGADAVLVGSALSASPDPRAAVRSLASVPKVPRG